jgi:hypothetical protein
MTPMGNGTDDDESAEHVEEEPRSMNSFQTCNAGTRNVPATLAALGAGKVTSFGDFPWQMIKRGVTKALKKTAAWKA